MTKENVLPRAVQAQIDQADAIIAEMQKEQDSHSEAKPEGAEVIPQESEVAVEETAEKPERTDWKQKYNVLQGKYDAEVPRLHSDLRTNQQQIGQLTEQITSLNATIASIKELQKPAPEKKPLVTQDEIEQFGPDLIDVVQRVAQQAVAPYVDKKVGEVAKTVKQVGEKTSNLETGVAQSARDKLYEKLDGAVEGWEVINKDQAFLNWLAKEDPVMGEVRGNILRGHFERNDADRVIKIFKGFQKEHVVETDPGADAPESAEKSGQEPHQTLDDLVAPGTPKTGSTDAQGESGKQVWTQREISALYAEKNEFVKKGKPLPERLVHAEADLFRAQHEGRVR